MASHWLDNYSSNTLSWQKHTSPTSSSPSSSSSSPTSTPCYTRPLGLVESSFSTDGTCFGGRADITATLTLHISHTLSTRELRRRIVLAWTAVRVRHVLLKARVGDDEGGFVVDVPGSVGGAVEEAEGSVVWFEDFDFGVDDGSIDERDVHYHALNTSRIIQPSTSLSKLHILPLVPQLDGTHSLRLLIVLAHQIADGLSAYTWFSDFISTLNLPISSIEENIATSIHEDRIREKLPPAQESLYPKVSGNTARQRWFWAIMRVLRHVQRTMPPTFANPLFRAERLDSAIALPATYAPIFDYSQDKGKKPPMSSGHVSAILSRSASERMISLCRASKISIGAGCFALAGLAMMDIHARLTDSSSSTHNLSFGASFPLNPRAFFTPQPDTDSCMLSFSEGIVMPYLPDSIPVERRFTFVARHANRELRVYQKRLRQGDDEGVGMFDRYSPARLLATGYVAQMERVDDKLPVEKRTGFSPQGGLKARVGRYGATCGVSSVGSLAGYFKKGEYDVLKLGDRDFAADYRGLRMGVRARENEFLIGSSSDEDGIIGFGVSYDECAISREAAEEWARTIEGLLEPESTANL